MVFFEFSGVFFYFCGIFRVLWYFPNFVICFFDFRSIFRLLWYFSSFVVFFWVLGYFLTSVIFILFYWHFLTFVVFIDTCGIFFEFCSIFLLLWYFSTFVVFFEFYDVFFLLSRYFSTSVVFFKFCGVFFEFWGIFWLLWYMIFSAFSRLINLIYFLLRLVFFYDFLLLRLVFFSTSLRLVFFKIYLEIGVFFAFLELMVFFFIVFFNWKQQVRTQPHIKTLSQLKSKSEPTFDSKKPESQLCLRWMFLFSCLFFTFVFFRLTLEINDAFHFLEITIFFDFSLEIGAFSTLLNFFSVSFQIGLEINALLEFLEIFSYYFFRLSWYSYSLFSLQIIVFLRFPSLQIKFFSFFLILLCLWPTLNDSAPAVRLSSNAITLVYLNSFIFSWDYVLLRLSSLEISIFRFS